jgi:hypothetical protein
MAKAIWEGTGGIKSTGASRRQPVFPAAGCHQSRLSMEGTASYYGIEASGGDATGFYPETKPAAKQVKG